MHLSLPFRTGLVNYRTGKGALCLKIIVSASCALRARMDSSVLIARRWSIAWTDTLTKRPAGMETCAPTRRASGEESVTRRSLLSACAKSQTFSKKTSTTNGSSSTVTTPPQILHSTSVMKEVHSTSQSLNARITTAYLNAIAQVSSLTWTTARNITLASQPEVGGYKRPSLAATPTRVILCTMSWRVLVRTRARGT